MFGVASKVDLNPNHSYWFDNPDERAFWLDPVMTLGKTGFPQQLPAA